MRIITDTSAMISPEEAAKLELTVIPACTIIGDQVYRDYEDISSEGFLAKIAEGATPTSSQPSIGDVLGVYQQHTEETLVLPIGDGLSGTYQNMEGAKNMLEDSGHIHVLNTKTLAGPLNHLAQKAAQLRQMGLGIESIKESLQRCIDSSMSFVIPQDFDFLRRSGRLTPVAAKIGSLLKIIPILTQTQDMRRITLFAIKRTKRKAVSALIEHLKERGVDEKYLITVAHGGVKEEALAVLQQLKEQFTRSAFGFFLLPPALLCHGGPGCILVQAIMM